MPQQQAHLTSSSELPTYTVAGQQPRDAAPEALCRLILENPATSDPLRASPWPQRKDLGHQPAFAIGLMSGKSVQTCHGNAWAFDDARIYGSVPESSPS